MNFVGSSVSVASMKINSTGFTRWLERVATVHGVLTVGISKISDNKTAFFGVEFIQ